MKKTAALPADKQVEAVAAKLKGTQPRLRRQGDAQIEDGVVTELQFLTDKVTDISPVRALTGLRTPRLVSGTIGDKGTACRPVAAEGHEADDLYCDRTQVSDLSPLKGMQLTDLDCCDTKVSDLSPLKDMKLTYWTAADTPVSDLSPLKDMKLTNLNCCDHAGVRPVAAEGHEADAPGLRAARRCPTCRR